MYDTKGISGDEQKAELALVFSYMKRSLGEGRVNIAAWRDGRVKLTSTAGAAGFDSGNDSETEGAATERSMVRCIESLLCDRIASLYRAHQKCARRARGAKVRRREGRTGMESGRVARRSVVSLKRGVDKDGVGVERDVYDSGNYFLSPIQIVTLILVTSPYRCYTISPRACFATAFLSSSPLKMRACFRHR